MEQSDLDLSSWEASVGKIVTSVARLEGELLLKYENHSQLSRSKYKADDTLSNRFNRVTSLFNLECESSIKTDAIFAEFEKLVELRNLVAHNPVFYESEEKGFRITNGRSKNRYIHLSEISKLAEHAFSTGLEMAMLFRRWPKKN